jgi:hypothetical protein
MRGRPLALAPRPDQEKGKLELQLGGGLARLGAPLMASLLAALLMTVSADAAPANDNFANPGPFRGATLLPATSAQSFPKATSVQRAISGAPKMLRNSHWSGYAVNARSSFREIAGGWTMPEVTCRRGQKSTISFWVGLGGFTPAHGKIEQIGADTTCGIRGRTSRYAWVELFPDGTIEIPVKVGAGDQIAASVGVRGSRVSMHLEDITRGTSFSKTLLMHSPDLGSAEWIAETPADCNRRFTACKFLPAPRFDPVEFVGARAATSGGPISAIDAKPFSVTAISLIDHPGRQPNVKGLPPLWGSNARVIPSQLSANGESFTETNEAVHPANRP